MTSRWDRGSMVKARGGFRPILTDSLSDILSAAWGKFKHTCRESQVCEPRAGALGGMGRGDGRARMFGVLVSAGQQRVQVLLL